MKLISWNVNGLRAMHKKGGFDRIMALKPDILCLQEIKATVDQLPDDVRAPKGYHAFFESPKVKKGYSGVAIYTRVEPKKVEYALGVPELDEEGRLIAAHFDDFALLNVYFPNGGGGPVRLQYKLDFYDAFLAYVNKLKKKTNVIFTGDINTAHEAIDLARPKENEKNTGFLPEERAWLDEVVNAGFVDLFRHFYPDKAGVYTYWDQKTAARDRNVGWRIDYFFADAAFVPKIKSFTTHSDIYGSDHCPIEIEIS